MKRPYKLERTMHGMDKKEIVYTRLDARKLTYLPSIGAFVIKFPGGDTRWYVNGKYHRIGGPAVDWENGPKQWWINGKSYDERDYWIELARRGYDIKNDPNAITGLI